MPVAVTVKLLATPAVTVVDAGLVITTLPLITVRVNDCVTLPLLLAALTLSGNVPTPLAVGVPASVAVPSPLSVKVTPEGSGPASESAGAG